jgi:hypothetical protein
VAKSEHPPLASASSCPAFSPVFAPPPACYEISLPPRPLRSA